MRCRSCANTVGETEPRCPYCGQPIVLPLRHSKRFSIGPGKIIAFALTVLSCLAFWIEYYDLLRAKNPDVCAGIRITSIERIGSARLTAAAGPPRLISGAVAPLDARGQLVVQVSKACRDQIAAGHPPGPILNVLMDLGANGYSVAHVSDAGDSSQITLKASAQSRKASGEGDGRP